MTTLNEIWGPLALLPILFIALMMWLAGVRWSWVRDQKEDLKPDLQPSHVIVALICFLVLYSLGPVFYAVIPLVLKPSTLVGQHLLRFLLPMALLIGTFLYSRKRIQISKSTPFFKTLVVAVLSFVVLVPIMHLAFDINSDIYHTLSRNVDIHPTITELRDQSSNLTLFFLIALSPVVLAPLLEEVMYRGYLQPAATSLMGVHWGILAQSLLFTINHPAGTFLPIFVFAIALSYTRQWSGSVIPGILMHICLNGNTIVNIYKEAQPS